VGAETLEREFWSALEFRVCREMDNMPTCRRQRLWCDGFIPEQYQFDRLPSSITGGVWIVTGQSQEKWKFTLILPPSASSGSEITWSDLLPPDEASGWFGISVEKKEIRVRLNRIFK